MVPLFEPTGGELLPSALSNAPLQITPSSPCALSTTIGANPKPLPIGADSTYLVGSPQTLISVIRPVSYIPYTVSSKTTNLFDSIAPRPFPKNVDPFRRNSRRANHPIRTAVVELFKTPPQLIFFFTRVNRV
jgi:hypothetical protein